MSGEPGPSAAPQRTEASGEPGPSPAPQPARRADRRLVLGVVAVVAVVALLVALVISAGGEKQSSAAPATAALGLVPADALVALDLSTDGDRPAVRRAALLARRLPSLPGLRRRLLARLDARGCGLDLREDDGDEIAFALLPGRGGVASPLLVTDAPAEGLGEGSTRACGALAVRRIDELVAIGPPEALSAAAAVAAGMRPALVESTVYRRAAAGLPRERVLSAWTSVSGARRLLEPLGGLLGTLAAIVDVPGLQGAVGALVAEDAGARFTVRRIADRRSAAPEFEPTLQERAPADTISYVASGDLAGGLQRLLLLLAGDESPAAALERLLAAGDQALVRLSRVVRESAFLVAPGSEGPLVTLLARVRDAGAAAARMRELEPALARVTGAPQGARFAGADLGGPARQLRSGSASFVAYGIDGNVLVLSTTPAGVAAARGPKAPLAGSESFEAVFPDLPPRVASLVFLDPNQLLRLGADTGTGLDDALQDVRDDLARVRAIGVHAAGTGTSSTVELSLSIP